jgi:sigma-B regulation protein RsbU (phosphoserine phosphatase)
MNWNRDRLAGTVTDTILVLLLVAVAYALNRLHIAWTVPVRTIPLVLELFLFAGIVVVPVSLYSPVERRLYAFNKRLLRPELDRLHRAADELFRSCIGLFELDPMLARVMDGLEGLTGGARLALFLPEEEEGVLRLTATRGFSEELPADLALAEEGPLAASLAQACEPSVFPDRRSTLDGAERLLLDRLGGEPEVWAVPLHTAGALTGVLFVTPQHRRRGAGRLQETLMLLLARLAVLIEDARLYSLARRESLEKDLLFEVGSRISAALDRDQLLETVMDGLARVVGYDAAGVFLVDGEQGRIEHHIVRGYDETVLDEVGLRIGEGLVGRAAETAQPILVSDVRDDPWYVDARPTTRSEIVLPVTVEGRILAVINLESDRLGAYTRKDLRRLQRFGNQAAIALQNARLYEEARQKRSLEQELELAWEIQRALLPRSMPEMKGVEAAAYMRPSRSVGGDLYDLVPLGPARLGVAIGDVSGKGTPAAILMASLYASFRSLTRGALNLPQIMARLNDLLCENTGVGRYATFFYGVLDRSQMLLHYSNAGHFPPLLLRPGEEPRLLTEGGIVLGWLPGSAYQEGQVELEPGDVLLLYTDGLIEAEDAAGEMFGEERIADVAATVIGRNAREVLEELRIAVETHCGDREVGDDLTMVVLRVD